MSPSDDWVEVLREQCQASSQGKVAKHLGISPAVVSQLLRRRYPGDLAAMEGRVRGAYMQATVECPILGELGRDVCLKNQRLPFAASSPHRVALYHACRGDCPHSSLNKSSS